MTATSNHGSSGCCAASTDVSSSDCCSNPRLDKSTTAALDEIRFEEPPPDVAAIRSTGFKLLLDTGRPVAISDLVTATGIPAERVTEIIGNVRARGRVELDNENRLIGLAGLSLTPGRHEITIGGITRWTWCALDAIGILGALNATGTVKSTDPQTGHTITIAFNNGRPETDAHLFILSGYSEDHVREEWCPRVNFFDGHDAASEWAAANGLDGDTIAVADVTGEAAAMWESVVNPKDPQVS